MKNISKRVLTINLPTNRSAFLWGPRKTGKTFWLRQTFPEHVRIDLLQRDVFGEYAARPSLLRERYQDHRRMIIIDEVQMVPDLLHEVHWLIENRGSSFLMTGSSARKIRRKHANLLGGRAWRYTMHPLTFLETQGFDLEGVMVSGLLPPHFLSPDPIRDLRSYVADYLKEEIAAEAAVQSIPAFSEFLRVAALTSGELLNYTNVAREAGVSAKVVRSYFQILEDTLLGLRVASWRRSKTRRMIETEKFYLFDVGVANYLSRRAPREGTPEFGKAFEHYILMELKAYQAYRNPEMDIRYWRTSTGMEVDFILGEMDVALEIKGARRVHEGDLKGLTALLTDHKVKHPLLLSLEREPRKIGAKVRALPWAVFLRELWSGGLGV
ncbi:MAG: ATP-binding protein [candidate division NC10 bacterium]|nr:ATP-binding protein [candidate division NC10 bacterium]